MYLIQDESVGLISFIYMYGDDFNAFGNPVHKDCFQKCICMSKFTGSIPRNFHSLNPAFLLNHWCLSLALNKFYNKLAKSYTKEDENVLLETPRQI